MHLEELRQSVAMALMKKLSVHLVEEQFSAQEKEYLCKTLVHALTANDDPHLR